jgi:hypothetical protein
MNRRIIVSLLALPLLLMSLPTANAATSADVSSNWAGYVASAGTFTSVGGSWAIPQAAGTNSSDFSADATWVGIGGVSGTDLIQAGTQDIIQNGTSTYTAWYELLPASSIQIPLVVHPGDAMTVSVAQQTNGQWQISFSDATTGQNYQTSVSYSSSLSSAEWIEEMPSDERGFAPLDDFGTVSFTNGFSVENGSEISISGSGADAMTMTTENGQTLAVPSPLGSDGASFTVTRTDTSSSSVPPATRTGRWSRTGTGIQGYTPRPRPSQTQATGRGFSIERFRYLFGNFSNGMRGMTGSLGKIGFRNRQADFK